MEGEKAGRRRKNKRAANKGRRKEISKRKIEEFCQENEDNEMVKQILEIMYEADEENGFVAPQNQDDSDSENDSDDL